MEPCACLPTHSSLTCTSSSIPPITPITPSWHTKDETPCTRTRRMSRSTRCRRASRPWTSWARRRPRSRALRSSSANIARRSTVRHGGMVEVERGADGRGFHAVQAGEQGSGALFEGGTESDEMRGGLVSVARSGSARRTRTRICWPCGIRDQRTEHTEDPTNGGRQRADRQDHQAEGELPGRV